MYDLSVRSIKQSLCQRMILLVWIQYAITFTFWAPVVRSFIVKRPSCSIFHQCQRVKNRHAVLRASSNDESKDAQDGDDDDDDDEAFGAWVSSNLMQWPLAPSSTAEDSRSSSPNLQDPTNVKEVPLLSIPRMFNIEILLNLTQQQQQQQGTAITTDETEEMIVLPTPDTLAGTNATTPLPEGATLPLQTNGTGSFVSLPFLWDNANKQNKSSSSVVESWIQQASTNIEYLLTEVAALDLLSPTNATDLMDAALDMANVTERARSTAAALWSMAAERLIVQRRFAAADILASFPSVRPVTSVTAMERTAQMGSLSAAIYEETLPRIQQLGHSMVAMNTTEDVTWMVTDSLLLDETDADVPPTMVRCLTIRGYDASDETVDRERLLRRICTANPQEVKGDNSDASIDETVVVHAGLYQIAQEIFRDAVVPYLHDWKAPGHKIVITGHSVGGSLSVLLLLILMETYGEDWCRRHIHKIYSFGSPPVMACGAGNIGSTERVVPTDLIDAYVQPWDPIVRLFSPIDALYPLVTDTGADGITPFADGPPRTLRPLLKPILEAWDGWPRFRETFRGTGNVISYRPVGVQHILLPEPTRYLADRFVSVDVWVPPMESMMQLDSEELYAVLETVFPLDVFEVSFVPQAIRSFVHHFYPAYCNPIVEHAKELRKQKRQQAVRKNTTKQQLVAGPMERNGIAVETSGKTSTRGKRKISQWFSGRPTSKEQIRDPASSAKNKVP